VIDPLEDEDVPDEEEIASLIREKKIRAKDRLHHQQQQRQQHPPVTHNQVKVDPEIFSRIHHHHHHPRQQQQRGSAGGGGRTVVTTRRSASPPPLPQTADHEG
jgi:hypothetical protein